MKTQAKNNPWRLTDREVEVCRLLEDNPTAKQMARRLDIKVYTVNDHLKKVFEKMGVQHKTKAALVFDRWARSKA